MKTVGGILFGIGMALMWCVVFESPIGILFGISMGLCMTAALNSSGKKEEKPEQKESENSENNQQQPVD